MLTENETKARQHGRYDAALPEGPNVWVLPGYVEAGTTYESHTFYVEWTCGKWAEKSRPTATLWVSHGAGVESIDVTKFARPLRDMKQAGGMERGAHRLCWGVFALAHGATSNGATRERQSIFRAFVEGRLRKRKLPKRTDYKVWIERGEMV